MFDYELDVLEIEKPQEIMDFLRQCPNRLSEGDRVSLISKMLNEPKRFNMLLNGCCSSLTPNELYNIMIHAVTRFNNTDLFDVKMSFDVFEYVMKAIMKSSSANKFIGKILEEEWISKRFFYKFRNYLSQEKDVNYIIEEAFKEYSGDYGNNDNLDRIRKVLPTAQKENRELLVDSWDFN